MSFLSSILPTAGGILGGIGGAALGAVAAPFTGSVVNPIDAGIAGAGLGDTAGRAGENLMTHQNIKNDLGSSFLQGGIGQATGDVGGALLGRLFGGVSGAAESAATNSLRRQSGGFLSREDSQNLLDRGVTNFSQANDLVPQITGAPGGEGAAYTNAVQTAMENAKDPLDITQEATNWQNLLRPHSLSLSNKQISDLSDNINHSFGKMASDSGQEVNSIPTVAKTNKDTIPTLEPGSLSNMSAGSVYSNAQELQNLGNTIEKNAPKDMQGNITDPAKAAQADIYKNLGNQLEQKATSSVALTDADKAALKSSISGIEKTNPTLYNSLTGDIDAADNWQDIIHQQAPWVRISQAQQAMDNIANRTPGSTASDVALSGKTGLLGAVAKSKGANRLETALTSKVAGLTTKGTEDTTSTLSKALGISKSDAGTIQKIIPLASRASALTVANAPNDMNSVQSNSSPTAALTGTETAMNGTAQNPLSQVYNTLLPELEAPGASLTPGFGNITSTLQNLAPVLQKQQLAAPALEQALSTYANAGGAQGMGQGLISKALGLIPGTAANTYNQASTAAAAQLAALLGISPQEAAALLPQLTQTQQVAAPQIGGVQSILGNIGATSPSAIPAQ